MDETVQIHHAVADIYRRSPEAFQDTEHLVAALSDYVDTDGAGSGEIRLVVDAVELGAFQRLQDLSTMGASPHAAIMETAAVLARKRATDEDRSAWACAVLAFAVGLLPDLDVQTYRMRWEMPTALPPSPTAAAPPTSAATQAPPPPVPAPVSTPYPAAPSVAQPQYPTAVYQQTQQPWTSGVPAPAPAGGFPAWAAGLGVAIGLAIVAAIVLVVLAPWKDDDPPDDPDDPVVAGVPQVGSCHALSTAEISADSDSKDAIDCADPAANTITTDIATLPADVDRSSSEAIWNAISKECVATTFSYLGGNTEAFARSAYSIIYFVPTPDEVAAGADWVRCDLTLFSGGGTRPLPEVEGSIDQLPLADEVALCAEDSETSGGLFTTCDQTHAFRVTGSFFHAGARPTDAELTTLGQDTCPGELEGGGTYAFAHAPDQAFWDGGATYILCFSYDT